MKGLRREVADWLLTSGAPGDDPEF